MNYGKALKHAREAREITQRQLSKAVGISHTYIAHIEAGRKKPTLGKLEAICLALGLRLSEFCKLAEEYTQ